ncbi:DUF4259 domain-containing protein [Streptomyces sp. NPDC018584]
MGTWGAGPFGNDTAADFCGELDEAAAGERTPSTGSWPSRPSWDCPSRPRLPRLPRCHVRLALHEEVPEAG